MAYTSLSFAPNEILTSGKMNQVAANFAALVDGTAIANNAIIARHIAAGVISSDKINQANWLNISRYYGYRTSNQSTTSASNIQLFTDTPSGAVQVAHTTKTGRVKVRAAVPCGNNANNMQISVLVNGAGGAELNNFSINDSSMKYGESQITGLTPNTSYNFGVYIKVDGGATATFYAFRTITLIIEDY